MTTYEREDVRPDEGGERPRYMYYYSGPGLFADTTGVFFVGNWLAGCCIPPFIRILGLKPRFLIPQVSAGEVGRKDGEPFFTLFVFYRGSG